LVEVSAFERNRVPFYIQLSSLRRVLRLYLRSIGQYIHRSSKRVNHHHMNNYFAKLIFAQEDMKVMQKKSIRVYIHQPAAQVLISEFNDRIAYYEISPKEGLTIKDILREINYQFFHRFSNPLPFTIVLNHSKIVDLEEEVREGDRVDIHLAIVTGG